MSVKAFLLNLLIPFNNTCSLQIIVTCDVLFCFILAFLLLLESRRLVGGRLLPLAGGQSHEGAVWTKTYSGPGVWLLRGRVHVSGGLRVGHYEVGAVQRDMRVRDSGGHQEDTGASSERGKRLRRSDHN